MATENKLSTFSYPAATDLSTKQYRFVKVSSLQAAVAGRGDLALGVLQNAPAAAARAATIGFAGVTKVVLGGTVTNGQALVSDANGAAVNASSADNNFMGIALASGVSGEIIEMLLQPRGLS